MYTKNHDYITFFNSFITYHKNDLEILKVTTMCLVSKSDCQIERYRMIKFAKSACIVRGEANHMWLIEINFDWLLIKLIKWIYVISGVFFF